MSFILLKKIFFLFFIVSFSQLFADIVYLKNGKKIEGKIVNQSRTQIQIEINGKLELIDKQNINKIEFENLEERKKQEELKRQQEEERKKQEELKRQQEEERKKISPDDIKFVYLRSLVFPGWGHYKINEKNQSYLWGGLFWGFLIATVAQANKTISLQKDYDNFSKTQFTLGNLDIIPQELSLYFSSEATQKTQAIKKAINQTQALGIATVIIYLTQFYFLRNDLNSIVIKEHPHQNDISIVETRSKQLDVTRYYPATDSMPVWHYSTNF